MALTVSLCRVSQLRHDTRETCLAMLKRPAIYSFLQWRCVSPETSAAGVAGGTQAEGCCVLGVLIKYCPPPPTPPPPPSVPVYQGRRQPGTQGRVDGHVLLPELLTKGVAPTGTSFASISLFKLLGEGVCESCSFTQGRLSSRVTDQ